jgi:hypothetical protein
MLNGQGAQIGTKFSVTSPLTGPSGATEHHLGLGLDWDGSIRLITGTP